MGLCLIGDFKGSKEILCGYIGFGCMRIAIAKAMDGDFGKAYEEWYKDLGHHDYLRVNMNKLITSNLAKKQIQPRAIKFLFKSDCDGYITPATCRNLLPFVEIANHSISIGYSAYATKEGDWDTFIEILKECDKRGKKLIWY